MIKDQLKAVESFIEAQPQVFDEHVVDYMAHICQSKGKLLRPALALLTAGALGGIKEPHIQLGAMLEMIHTATLVHDDVIDKASKRRDIPTPNALWGNSLAILLGDVLFAQSMMLGANLGDIDFCRRLCVCVRDVCHGEVIQSTRLFDLSLTREEYLSIIGKKTATLFEGATWGSAWLSKASPSLCEELASFGHNLGMAYQIYDDCLDLVGEEEQTGKTLSTDAESGKITLPVLNLLTCGNDSIVHTLRQSIQNRQSIPFHLWEDSPEYATALAGAVDTAKTYVSTARDALLHLPANPFRDALAEMTFYFDELLGKCS